MPYYCETKSFILQKEVYLYENEYENVASDIA